MSDETEATAAAEAVPEAVEIVAEVIGGQTRMMIGEGGAQFEVNWPPAEWLREKIARSEVQVIEPPAAVPAKKAAKSK